MEQIFKNELEFERALIEVLIQKNWNGGILHSPTQEDLIENWKKIIFKNNRGIDQLNDCELTDGEMGQILDKIETLRTPVKLNSFFIASNSISIKRDNPEDKLNYGKEVSLEIFDKNANGAGDSVYQIAEQPILSTPNKIVNDRRGDIMLLINGMPLIHIELKRSGVSVGEACTQIQKYSKEGAFTGIYSLIQVFVAMTPDETVYFANPGEYTKFNQNFYFHWAYKKDEGDENDENKKRMNEKMNNWKEIAVNLLPIPMAHQLVSLYTIADTGDNTLKVMRSYQCYAVEEILKKVENAKFVLPNQYGGYIWHTTGSGKTMTSFKAAQIISESKYADKVVFLLDRIELGVQSLREYKNFAIDEDSVQETKHTGMLISKLKSNNKKDALIVTSIQKMSRIKDDYGLNAADIDVINNKRLVFIVDECHRDVFGKMMYQIKETFPYAIFFGFTGTPIIKEEKAHGLKTSDVFGGELHRYSIADGIRDKNVLGFDTYKISTYKDSTLREKVALEQAKVKNLDEVYNNENKTKIYNKFMNDVKMYDVEDENGNIIKGIESYLPKGQYKSEKHHKAVKQNILENYQRISQNYKYSAIFATSSITEAIEYYRLFKEDPNCKIKITCLFDPYIDNKDGFNFKEDGLIEIIEDYNKRYDMQFTMANFSQMKKDIGDRFARKVAYNHIKEEEKIDMLIVVDQMLTGFDSKWINALYLDKVLRSENIIQAFSRTNRLCDENKTFGIIKYYRYPHTMEQNLNKAVELYAGNTPVGLFVDKLEQNINKINNLYEEIKELFENNNIYNFEKLPEEPADRRKFAQLYKAFKIALNNARIQGLYIRDKEKESLNKDISNLSNIEDQSLNIEEESADRRKFVQLNKDFKIASNNARIQGLYIRDKEKEYSNKDISNFSNIEDKSLNAEESDKGLYIRDEEKEYLNKDISNLSNIEDKSLNVEEESAEYTVEKNPNNMALSKALTITRDEIEKIEQRGKDLATTSINVDENNIGYDITPYITEYDNVKINTEYLDSKFKKYIKNLNEETETNEITEKALVELKNSFAYLSEDQQKFAKMIIEDIKNNKIQIEKGKTFIDYINEYQEKAKNDEIEKIVELLGLSEEKLRRMLALHLTEASINEYGYLDDLVNTVNMQKLQEYLQQKENKSVNGIKLRLRARSFIKNYILYGKME